MSIAEFAMLAGPRGHPGAKKNPELLFFIFTCHTTILAQAIAWFASHHRIPIFLTSAISAIMPPVVTMYLLTRSHILAPIFPTPAFRQPYVQSDSGHRRW